MSDLDWVWDYNLVEELPRTQADGLLSPGDSLAYHPTPPDTGLDSAAILPSNHRRSDVLDSLDLDFLSTGTNPHMKMSTEYQDGFFMNNPLPGQADMASYPSLGRSMAQSSDVQRTAGNRLISTEAYSNSSNVGQKEISPNAAHRSIQKSSLTTTTPENLVDSISASRDYQTDQENGDDSSFRISPSVLTSTPPSSIGTVAPQISNTKDLLSIIKNYPRLLLQDDYRSPFIHHKLYPSSCANMSSMTKSGMAICCASAYEDPNSVEFVSKFIIAERERFVHTFVSLPMLYSILWL